MITQMIRMIEQSQKVGIIIKGQSFLALSVFFPSVIGY
jgi:hypothetical protein